MSSDVAAAATSAARLPVRARGHRRVSAILDAAAAVLLEKGYDAATMTEIAARSQTAIGSLYRFFPTKSSVADALLERYALEIDAHFAALEARAASLSATELTDACLAFVLAHRADRAAAVALVDIRPDGPSQRSRIRTAVRHGIAAALRARAPQLPEGDAADAAAVILQMLKGARALADEPRPGPAQALRTALRLYVAHCLGEPVA